MAGSPRRKRAKKSPKEPVLWLGHGGKSGLRGSLNGNPGNKGGGRPPDEFLRIMREMASDPVVLQRLESILKNAPPKLADLVVRTWERVANRGYGMPKQPVELEPSANVELTFTLKPAAPD